jgi:hypothetical protein
MRKFVIWFAVVAPLLLWLLATLALILTAPIWINIPGCCLIDNAALLSWLSVLPWAYAVFILPAAAAAVLLFMLHRRFGCFEPSSMALSLLTGLAGSLFVSYRLHAVSFPYGTSFETIDLIIAGAVFGILFSAMALSALIARRFSRAIP